MRRKIDISRYRWILVVHICMLIINCCLPPACRKVIPTLYEAAPPDPQRGPPSPTRWSHAVRPLPQRYRPLAGASTAVLEVGVHKRQSGFRQGNADNMNAIIYFFTFLSYV